MHQRHLPAEPVGALEEDDLLTDLGTLGRGGQPRGTTPDGQSRAGLAMPAAPRASSAPARYTG